MTARHVGQLLVVGQESQRVEAILTSGSINAIYDEVLDEPEAQAA